MNAWLRGTIYTSFGLLWLTGCAWLLLHFFFQSTTDFGTAPHPWQPCLMVVHGVLAVAAIFFFGWIVGSHLGEHWPRRANRASGIALIASVTLLAITGVAGYYLTFEPLRNTTALWHEAGGASALIPAVFHWLGKRKMRSETSRPE